jgi:hypothetical protein
MGSPKSLWFGYPLIGGVSFVLWSQLVLKNRLFGRGLKISYGISALNSHRIFTNSVAEWSPSAQFTRQQLHMLILGCPGSGKGTQARWIERDFNVERIATGDLLREHVINNTNIGQDVKVYLERGGNITMGVRFSMDRDVLQSGTS